MTLDDFKKENHNKRAWLITMMYFHKCSLNEAFVNKKPSKHFWQVRAFMMKQESSVLDNLFCYLNTIKEHKELSLTDVFNLSEQRIANAFIEKNMNRVVGDYQKVNVNDWLNG